MAFYEKFILLQPAWAKFQGFDKDNRPKMLHGLSGAGYRSAPRGVFNATVTILMEEETADEVTRSMGHAIQATTTDDGWTADIVWVVTVDLETQTDIQLHPAVPVKTGEGYEGFCRIGPTVRFRGHIILDTDTEVPDRDWVEDGRLGEECWEAEEKEHEND